METSSEQLSVFGVNGIAVKPVNVASVPLRSPFRYPGGKTWFVPYARKWLRSMKKKPFSLIEPFAGGAIISMTALFENLVDNIVLVEKDEWVASVWQVLADGAGPELAKKILTFNLTPETVMETLNMSPRSVLDLAFQTVLRNRTFHGGIIAPGSGVLKRGESGKGITSRWYPETLSKRLLAIHSLRTKISVYNEDAFEHIRTRQDDPDVAWFIDPPYTAGGKNAGRRLYRYHAIDHVSLFEKCSRLRSPYIMTYDDSQEVVGLAGDQSMVHTLVPMKNTHHENMYELVISDNLEWLNS